MGLDEQFEQGLKPHFAYSTDCSADADSRIWMVGWSKISFSLSSVIVLQH